MLGAEDFGFSFAQICAPLGMSRRILDPPLKNLRRILDPPRKFVKNFRPPYFTVLLI